MGPVCLPVCAGPGAAAPPQVAWRPGSARRDLYRPSLCSCFLLLGGVRVPAEAPRLSSDISALGSALQKPREGRVGQRSGAVHTGMYCGWCTVVHPSPVWCPALACPAQKCLAPGRNHGVGWLGLLPLQSLRTP